MHNNLGKTGVDIKIAEYLIYGILIVTIFSGFFADLGLPHSICYLADVMSVFLVVLAIKNFTIDKIRQGKIPLIFMALWLLFMVFTSLGKEASCLRMLWALRNWYRFIPIFAAVFLFLSVKNIEFIFRWMKIFYWVNAALIIFEFAVLGLRKDNLSGLFGNAIGGNGHNNVFICIVLILCLYEWYQGGEFRTRHGLVFFSSLIIAGLSELKVYYFEFVLIVAVAFALIFLGRNVTKTEACKFVVWSLSSLSAGLYLLYRYYPYHFRVVTGKVSLLSYEETVREYGYVLGRISGVFELYEKFFSDSLWYALTGFGFGNCEYSAYSRLTSPFYNRYHYLNYLWCSDHLLFLEGGIIGLLLFVLIFLAFAAVYAKRLIAELKESRAGRESKSYTFIGFLYILIVLINLIYNSSIRTDIAYLSYFILAVGLLSDSIVYTYKE